jgi:diguanylate cyclase
MNTTSSRLAANPAPFDDVVVAAEDALAQHQTNLAVAAHELRNPLSAIGLALALLKPVMDREPLVSRAHGVIERQLMQMTRLVDDLLDASRAAAGELRVDLKVVELGPLVDTAVEAVRPALCRRHQSMDLRLPVETLRVDGDPMRLAQVLNNLLDNASKYTPEGGSIRLGLSGDAREVVVTVSDNGIGITPAVLPHVFEAFVRDAPAVDFDSQGLGIGLMLVHQLVRAHGGRIVARSRGRTRGSEFAVTLPRRLGED